MKRLLYAIITPVLVFSVSCVKNDGGCGPLPEPEEVLMEMTIRLPTVNLPTTRSLGPDAEGYIEHLDFLVFKVEADKETFLYTTHARELDGEQDNERRVKAYFKLSEASERHRFVFLANMRSELDALADVLTEGMLRSDVLQMLGFGAAGKWNFTADSDFRPLPMWGETRASYEITSSSSDMYMENVNMYRSLARIDLVLDEGIFPSVFEPEEIIVRNAPASGMAAPYEGNFDHDGGEAGKGRATGPSLPAFPTANGDLQYSCGPDGNLTATIYVPELDNSSKSDPDALYILVGGYYRGSATKTWYRVDIYGDTSPRARLDLLRNHAYRLTVTELRREGHSSASEAAASPLHPLEYTTLIWDDADYLDITYNQNYFIAVSGSEFYLDRNQNNAAEDDNTFLVVTDHPSGWRSGGATDYYTGQTVTWVLFNVSSGTAGSGTKVSILTRANDTGAERKAHLRIKAGTLEHILTVTQQG